MSTWVQLSLVAMLLMANDIASKDGKKLSETWKYNFINFKTVKANNEIKNFFSVGLGPCSTWTAECVSILTELLFYQWHSSLTNFHRTPSPTSWSVAPH